MKQIKENLSGKRVLVTGATGFFGGRLIERLVNDYDVEVRALVRNLARVSRIARFPIEIIQGDVLDAELVKSAAENCDVIFNCMAATDGSEEKQRRVNFNGVQNVFDAALAAQTSRVVHVSTVMVYGAPGDGDLDETAARQHSGDVYSDSKLDAENMAFDYAKKHGLPVAILQPTVVYGPFGPAWTTRIINEIKTGRIILVDGGEGLCNVVYVDDMVNALLLAAIKDEAVGEAFLISAEQPVTWREFYGGYEKMLDCTGTVNLSMAEAEEIFKNLFRRKSLVKESLDILLEDEGLRWRVRGTSEVNASLQIARKLLPASVRLALKRRLTGDAENGQQPISKVKDKPIHPAHPNTLRFQAAKTHVRIDKARRLLGYQPAFDLQAGLKLTEKWARWACLLETKNGVK